jgi:GGDEF domain-containing protein
MPRRCAREAILKTPGCAIKEDEAPIGLSSGFFACSTCIEPVFEKLYTDANTDFTTGIKNRRHISERIDEYDELGIKFGFIQADLIGFGETNKNRGQGYGDMILRLYAASLVGNRKTDLTVDLSEEKTSEDVASRIGGDEFGVLMVLKPGAKREDLQPRGQLLKAGHYFKQKFENNPVVIEYNSTEILEPHQILGVRFGVSVHASGMNMDSHIELSDPRRRRVG